MVLECPECGDVVRDQLRDHSQAHRILATHKCQECSFSASYQIVKAHMARVHKMGEEIPQTVIDCETGEGLDSPSNSPPPSSPGPTNDTGVALLTETASPGNVRPTHPSILTTKPVLDQTKKSQKAEKTTPAVLGVKKRGRPKKTSPAVKALTAKTGMTDIMDKANATSAQATTPVLNSVAPGPDPDSAEPMDQSPQDKSGVNKKGAAGLGSRKGRVAQCPECGVWTASCSLDQHMHCHGRSARYSCSRCSYANEAKNAVKIHCLRTHDMKGVVIEKAKVPKLVITNSKLIPDKTRMKTPMKKTLTSMTQPGSSSFTHDSPKKDKTSRAQGAQQPTVKQSRPAESGTRKTSRTPKPRHLYQSPTVPSALAVKSKAGAAPTSQDKASTDVGEGSKAGQEEEEMPMEEDDRGEEMRIEVSGEETMGTETTPPEMGARFSGPKASENGTPTGRSGQSEAIKKGDEAKTRKEKGTGMETEPARREMESQTELERREVETQTMTEEGVEAAETSESAGTSGGGERSQMGRARVSQEAMELIRESGNTLLRNFFSHTTLICQLHHDLSK